MQCVILAAGHGTRLRPLTDSMPKALVTVGDKALLNHIVEALPKEVDELIIVTGYLGDHIQKHCGEEFYGKKVRYVHQEVRNGTAGALWLCKDYIKDKFLYMHADDVHGAESLQEAVSHDRAILSYVHDQPENFGVLIKNKDGTLGGIVEKPKVPPTNLVSTGAMVLGPDVFLYEAKECVNGEYLMPEVLEKYAKENPVHIVEQAVWIPVNNHDERKRAEGMI